MSHFNPNRTFPAVIAEPEQDLSEDFKFLTAGEATQPYDTDQLEDAVCAVLLGWKLAGVELKTNPVNGFVYGNFLLEAPLRVDLRAFERHLKANTLVVECRISAIGRCRKRLREIVDDLKSNSAYGNCTNVQSCTPARSSLSFEPKDLFQD